MMDTRNSGWRPRRDQSDPARLVAYDVLRAVHDDGAYANLALPQILRRAHLTGRDAAFATNLTYGTLRLRGRWDAIISRCTQGRELAAIDPEVLDILRLGAHQLLELETPPHAAIYEMVTLTRNELSQNRGGFVNAVLRRVDEKAGQWEEILRKSSATRAEFLAMWYSHPRWVVEAFEESLAANGRDATDVQNVLEANNTPPKVALVPRDVTKRQLRRAMVAEGLPYAQPVLMPNALLLDSGDPHQLHMIQTGAAGVQDEGSQLIAAVAAVAPIEGPDNLWLDMCAGPGGKTATLASYAAERGARIHANEPLQHRLDLVASAVDPFADIVDLRLGTGESIGAEEPNTYDRVLLDAPCSGLGSLRRRPESRWTKRPEDTTELATLQNRLLASAFAALRPGGILIYSTCTPVLSETRAVIEEFLAQTPDATLVDPEPVATEVALRPIPSSAGMIQLWPDTDQSDAMFIAMVSKMAS